MKKYVLGVVLCILLAGSGCKEKEQDTEKEKPEETYDEISIMCVEAEYPEYQKFIDEAQKELNLKISVAAYPENAENRQAKISTILASGEGSVDIFSVNDEMVSEFKYKGYLEPLNDTVMTEDLLSCYPKSYMKNITMLDGKAYSVPYNMDLMMFWVNRKIIGDMDIKTMEDFQRMLEMNFGEGKFETKK